MSADRETIAEIEAVLRGWLAIGHVVIRSGPAGSSVNERVITGIPEAAAAIAALRSKDREDGAREMRERAIAACERRRERSPDAGFYDAGFRMGCAVCSDDLAALPLHPTPKGGGTDA